MSYLFTGDKMNILKGIAVGITMMIPGLSGGSTAMLLNVYDKLMDSISYITIKNIFFIFQLGLGILIGIFSFSIFLFKFTSFTYFSYLVIGIIILNILLLFKQYNNMNIKYISLIFIGYILMMVIKNLSSYSIELNTLSYFFIGLLIAVSLILPGLGATYVLYILGLYDKLNNAISCFDITFLISLGLSTLVGVILSAKLINFILKKDKFIIYSLVIGLLIGGI